MGAGRQHVRRLWISVVIVVVTVVCLQGAHSTGEGFVFCVEGSEESGEVCELLGEGILFGEDVGGASGVIVDLRRDFVDTDGELMDLG